MSRPSGVFLASRSLPSLLSSLFSSSWRGARWRGPNRSRGSSPNRGFAPRPNSGFCNNSRGSNPKGGGVRPAGRPLLSDFSFPASVLNGFSAGLSSGLKFSPVWLGRPKGKNPWSAALEESPGNGLDSTKLELSSFSLKQVYRHTLQRF